MYIEYIRNLIKNLNNWSKFLGFKNKDYFLYEASQTFLKLNVLKMFFLLCKRKKDSRVSFIMRRSLPRIR